MAKSRTALTFFAADPERAARVGVVAEVGVNHDGDMETARQLIDAAAEAGADGVKFQYFRAERLLSNQAELADYQKKTATSQRELLKKLELSIEQLGRLVECVHAAGLAAVVTPFSPGDPADLAGLGLDALKIASPDAVNPPLLKAAAAVGLPLLISTGTCTLDELTFVAELLRDHPAGGCLLHCVSSYPTPPEDAGLAGIGLMSSHFSLPVGYSDHTPSIETGGLAVVAGAVVIEKHLTHNRQAPGPDHAASLEPGPFKAYVHQVRLAQAMLGRFVKDAAAIEQDVRRVSRQSVCLTRDCPAGHVLDQADLTIKRPSTGIEAKHWESVIGRTLARPVGANELLHWDDLQ